MKNYNYQNNLIGKKQLRQLLAWSFTNYDSMQACTLADELKYLGFKYASQAGISISLEDLKVPFVKHFLLKKANQEILNTEKIYLKGKLTEVERFQKIIDTWNLTSESLKDQVIYYFKNYDPLNSVYIMAFSGARGNLSQVRQLVGMRGLMSDPSGEIMNLPIKKNFREGLTITDYLMSGYGARKGIVDTALKTANSGYLTRRLIDVSQDILIREKDCLTTYAICFNLTVKDYDKLLGRTLSKTISNVNDRKIIANQNTQISPNLIQQFKKYSIKEFYIRSPLTCNLYRAICQKCYGWDLANENLVDIGEAIGILAGQSIGEPGTQLTMRTFHTGGIFTSKTSQQIISPSNGVIKFLKMLKTIELRTNRGEDVLITKNSGFIILIPEDTTKDLIQIEILRNTILFPKNNQYVTKDKVIGELLNLNKQIKTEIKPILSDNCGEIFLPKLKKKINLSNDNKLIWILSGMLYNSPKNSFINFYGDYKLNPNNYIFRTKLINPYKGFIKFVNINKNFDQTLIQTQNNKSSIKNSYLEKLSNLIQNKGYLLNIQNVKYLVKIEKTQSKFYIKIARNNQIGIQLSNKFKTLTGGILYYDSKNLIQFSGTLYSNRIHWSNNYQFLVPYRSILWLNEEKHKVNCEANSLLVEQGDFISQGFELIPGIFSKTSGIVTISQKNNIIQSISIKSGLAYEGKEFKSISKKLYYPGEVILSSIPIKKLSFCEAILGKKKEQLLVRNLSLYEVPRIMGNINQYPNNFLESNILYFYKPNQTFFGAKNISLVSNVLNLSSLKLAKLNKNIQLEICSKKNQINFHFNEKINLKNYLFPDLKYKNIESCFMIQQNQFVDSYNILGYFESITLNSLEIVKIKIKKKQNKQIFLISNEDCCILEKQKFKDKKINDFIISGNNSNNSGKIILENKQNLTLQKGIPYFFPNCKAKNFNQKETIQYKILASNRLALPFLPNRKIWLNYFNILKANLKKDKKALNGTTVKLKAEFLKLFLKRNGKFYSSLFPTFLKKFTINSKSENLKSQSLLRPNILNNLLSNQLYKTVLFKSSSLVSNKYTKKENFQNQLILLKFNENIFTKCNKSIGIYSITEDYFEQDLNSIFCKNTEFIESGQTLGLLKLEKEITGDIVQGLPRIEEILEARKKNLSAKKIPTSQKKGLLAQKSSLDSNFDFKKLGIPLKESDKINPHKLLKVYFNYYGFKKNFVSDQTKIIKFNRLVQNYEGSYRSFKKVQSFILNSVQSVYQSQGVTINDKHLEVIIKQMTTKVIITYEGNTPLLRREVIDLYHIQYINKIVELKQKTPASYVPLLLGITKAALNNPSFISAASFQETTRVLTKAAMEGRIDWLRGLKENIIIGHLIPAGTGSPNYKNCFRKMNPVEFET